MPFFYFTIQLLCKCIFYTFKNQNHKFQVFNYGILHKSKHYSTFAKYADPLGQAYLYFKQFK